MAKEKSSKKEKIKSNPFKKTVVFFKKNSLPSVLSIILLLLLIFLYSAFITDKFYPLTYIGSSNISFLTQGQAIRQVESSLQQRSAQKLAFVYQNQSFTIDLATSSARIDYSLLDQSLAKQQAGFVWDKILRQFSTLFYPQQILLTVNMSLESQLEQIAKIVDKPYTDAQLLFDESPNTEGSPSARIQIKEGKDGLSLDRLSVEKAIADYLLFGKYQSLLPTKVVPPKITTEHVKRAKQALEQTQKQPIRLTFEKTSYFLDTKQLLALLDLTSGGDLLLDQGKTKTYISKIAKEIDQEVQEGLFEFNPKTKRVITFRPSQEGQKLDIEKTYNLITEALTSPSSKTIVLPVVIIKPKIQTSDVNSLGIKELIGQGISNFAGSIPNRIYNINLTAQKINGVLVPPGEIFSFNQTVGDITAATGFKQAYVIKEGRTVLDDGGGVCQDSTTLFRAVLNAGLPVVKRTAHTYRVGYYEQGFPPGLDATVFYPSVDFQFQNDTPAHILIQAYTEGATLYVDLYGTSDGRIAAISKSVVADQTPPPPELRQDDPTLPKGTVKQVDWAAWGAKVSFTRTVTRDGQVLIKETWNSSYKPWQAVYLVGTKE
ncbi:VanW family protein [Candidatus Daviesbacteria bacterium]|nr:VanW family protein [Candidatus Daviesbacteria bacterium]